MTETEDLRLEYRALADFCDTLPPAGWRQASPFHGWTPWDEIAHLLYFDETARVSAQDPERFAREAAALDARLAAGEAISAIARERHGALDGPALLARWREASEALVYALARLAPKDRLAWYGPSMSARSFATARLMETWAHGQDIWDAMRRRRPATGRLRHIAHLGVSTFGWTFSNRGLAVPDATPRVVLEAPGGGAWTWGDPAAADRVHGSAEDFCLVVTQRRHVSDTALQFTPGTVAAWLGMAQCFAGAPADGPAPGVRRLAFPAGE